MNVSEKLRIIKTLDVQAALKMPAARVFTTTSVDPKGNVVTREETALAALHIARAARPIGTTAAEQEESLAWLQARGYRIYSR